MHLGRALVGVTSGTLGPSATQPRPCPRWWLQTQFLPVYGKSHQPARVTGTHGSFISWFIHLGLLFLVVLCFQSICFGIHFQSSHILFVLSTAVFTAASHEYRGLSSLSNVREMNANVRWMPMLLVRWRELSLLFFSLTLKVLVPAIALLVCLSVCLCCRTSNHESGGENCQFTRSVVLNRRCQFLWCLFQMNTGLSLALRHTAGTSRLIRTSIIQIPLSFDVLWKNLNLHNNYSILHT